MLWLLVLSLLGQALSDITAGGDTAVYFGNAATLSCSVPQASGVKQVAWQRVRGGDVQTVATFSEQFKDYVDNQFVDKVKFTASLHSTTLMIKNTTFEDEACYVCSFKVYPTGPKRETKCITVKGISELAVAVNPSLGSDSEVVITCSATGKPTPTIQWKSEDQDLNIFIPSNFTTLNKDSSTTVTSNLTLPLSQFHGKYVECSAQSDGTERSGQIVLPDWSEKDPVNIFTIRNYIIPMLVLIILSIVIIAIFIHIKFRDKEDCKSVFIA